MYVGIRNMNIFNHKTQGTIMGAFSSILTAIMMGLMTPSPFLLVIDWRWHSSKIRPALQGDYTLSQHNV